MNRDDFRRRAAAARAVPLESVLVFRGAQRDRQDRTKWHTAQGPLSVTGPPKVLPEAARIRAAGPDLINGWL